MYQFLKLIFLLSVVSLVTSNYDGPPIQNAATVVVNRTVYLIQGYRIDPSTSKKVVLDQLLTLDTYKDFKGTDSPFVDSNMDDVLTRVDSLACAQLKPTDLGFQCFGGRGGSVDTIGKKAPSSRYDGDKKEWSKVIYNGDKEPSVRFGHRMVTLPDGSGIIMAGGADPKSALPVKNQEELSWYLDSQRTWKPLKSTNLIPVYFHSLSVIPADKDKPGLIVLIGGKTSMDNDKLVDTSVVYVYDLSLQSWKVQKVNNPIKARHSHSAVVRGRNIIVFGGTDKDGNLLNDIVQLDVDSFTYTSLSIGNTQGRSGHTAAIFNQFMLVFFGETKDLEARSLIFDLDKQVWTNEFIANKVTEEKGKDGNSNNLGAIIGGVVGGVVFLILIGAVFWYMRRRRLNNQVNYNTNDAEGSGIGFGVPLHEPQMEMEIDSGLDNFSTNIYSEGGSNYPSNLGHTRYNSETTNFNTVSSINATKP